MLTAILAVFVILATAAFWKELLAIFASGALILLVLGMVQLTELVHTLPR
jgi:hypothetical protein